MSGRVIREGFCDLAEVSFLRALGSRLRMNIQGTLLELYCLVRHGYTFEFTHDAKLIATPPVGGVVLVEWVFQLVRQQLLGHRLSLGEVNDVRSALLQGLESACSRPFLRRDLGDLIINVTAGIAPHP